MSRTEDVLVAGRRIRFVDCGDRSASTALLLVHGMGGHWEHWREVLPRLSRDVRVLALDLPGFGASERPAAPVSLEGYADVCAELAARRELRRVVLAGHSMGGPIALRFAARHAELAAGIVLVAGAVLQFSALLGLRAVARFAATRPRETAAIASEIVGAALPLPARLRARIAASPALRRLALAPYVRDPAALTPGQAALLLDGAGAPGVIPAARAIGRSDPLAGVADIRCPMLLVAGDEDRIAPLADTRQLERRVPAMRTVVLERCGHMPMLERPEQLAAELAAFTAHALAPQEART